MGSITAQNLPAVLSRRKLRSVLPHNAPRRGITEEDIAIAEEWFARLPQASLDDSNKPILTEGLLAMAAARYGRLTPADADAVRQAAYTLMIDRTYDALSTRMTRKRGRRTADSGSWAVAPGAGGPGRATRRRSHREPLGASGLR
jgi:hypothetical protein